MPNPGGQPQQPICGLHTAPIGVDGDNGRGRVSGSSGTGHGGGNLQEGITRDDASEHGWSSKETGQPGPIPPLHLSPPHRPPSRALLKLVLKGLIHESTMGMQRPPGRPRGRNHLG
jgi:hypothetical protein